jgi:tetratricopeptide (TPR) repeat protein
MALIIFLCNESKWTEIRGYIEDARKQISESVPYRGFWWTAGRTRKIQVGDRFVIQRTNQDPKGYFASGKVVAAPEQYQLRIADTNYLDLSEAYINDFNGESFRVAIEVESIVDFDYPLEIRTLRQQRQFIGANFHFQSCGCEFKAEYAERLYSEWEKHSMEFARKGFGVRLVDVWCEKGREYKNQKKYQDAIDCFEEALIYDPEYVKAKNGIKSCNLILERQSKVTSTDSIVQKNATIPTNDISTDNIGNDKCSDFS